MKNLCLIPLSSSGSLLHLRDVLGTCILVISVHGFAAVVVVAVFLADALCGH